MFFKKFNYYPVSGTATTNIQILRLIRKIQIETKMPLISY